MGTLAIILGLVFVIILLNKFARLYSFSFEPKNKKNHSKNVLLVIAHPDDECM